MRLTNVRLSHEPLLLEPGFLKPCWLLSDQRGRSLMCHRASFHGQFLPHDCHPMLSRCYFHRCAVVRADALIAHQQPRDCEYRALPTELAGPVCCHVKFFWNTETGRLPLSAKLRFGWREWLLYIRGLFLARMFVIDKREKFIYETLHVTKKIEGQTNKEGNQWKLFVIKISVSSNLALSNSCK